MKHPAGSISVIVVVRDGERYIAEALDSVQAQIVPVDEIIVVDGRSTDRTAEIVRQYDGVCWLQQPAHGLADARNTGVRAARGEWIAFLDHDDQWMPEKLERQFAALRANPDAVWTMGWLEFFADPEEQLAAEGIEERLGTPRPGPTPGTLLMRREAFDLVGPFDSRYAIGCDLEWIQRLRERHLPVAECRDVVLRKRLHGENLSRQRPANRRDIFAILRDALRRRR